MEVTLEIGDCRAPIVIKHYSVKLRGISERS